ncbi:MAG TPA: response regulator [Terriglobia bacterium]|nr:response regulator [Terriglobia bacterium]
MKLRVMAVDDEPAVLNVLKLQLEFCGCEVIDMLDSREALARLREEKIDGLFVDVIMPHVDGFLLTQQARLSKLNRRVPIVMLTGLDDAETMRRGFAAGANFFLGKPFTRERIYNLLGATRGPMLREKQRYARLSYRTSVDCTWGLEPQKRLRSSSVNISEGGMMLVPSGGSGIGQELEVAFNLPSIPHAIRTRAQVVREVPPNAIGIQFLKLSERDERGLQEYISARLEE